jgi:hypothetical protein
VIPAGAAAGGPARLRALAVLVAAVAFLLVYVAAEAVFRVRRHRELRALERLPRVRLLSAPLLRFDREVGFRYVPGARVRQTTLGADLAVVSTNLIRVNNRGHVHPRDEPEGREPGEFRIGVLGDSFTACTFNDLPWPAALEDRLNADAGARARRGLTRVRVMNFGMDATGFAQWPAVYAHEVARFAPDLLVVAFIENDLWRDFKWMDTLAPEPGTPYAIVLVSETLPVRLDNPDALLSWRVVMADEAADATQRRAALRAILDRKLAAMPWLSPRPELIGHLLARAQVDLPSLLRPRLSYRPERPGRFGNERRLVRAVQSMRDLARHGPTLFLHLPARPATDEQDGRLPELRARAPELSLRSLAGELGEAARQANTESWYQPDSGHLTDAGAQAYAAAAARVLADWLPPEGSVAALNGPTTRPTGPRRRRARRPPGRGSEGRLPKEAGATRDRRRAPSPRRHPTRGPAFAPPPPPRRTDSSAASPASTPRAGPRSARP